MSRPHTSTSSPRPPASPGPSTWSTAAERSACARTRARRTAPFDQCPHLHHVPDKRGEFPDKRCELEAEPVLRRRLDRGLVVSGLTGRAEHEVAAVRIAAHLVQARSERVSRAVAIPTRRRPTLTARRTQRNEPRRHSITSATSRSGARATSRWCSVVIVEPPICTAVRLRPAGTRLAHNFQQGRRQRSHAAPWRSPGTPPTPTPWRQPDAATSRRPSCTHHRSAGRASCHRLPHALWVVLDLVDAVRTGRRADARAHVRAAGEAASPRSRPG